jgi:hypothetical protein
MLSELMTLADTLVEVDLTGFLLRSHMKRVVKKGFLSIDQ